MYRHNYDHDQIADAVCLHLASQAGQLGLHVAVKEDFQEWVHVLTNAPATTAVSPAFDPENCDLKDAFWLELRDGSEWPVGTITAKLVPGDFLQLVASGELWYGRRTKPEHAMRLIDSPELPHLRGRIAYFGGLWLHPNYRGQGLVNLMPRLVRSLARRRWAADWHCGGVLKPLADARLPLRHYGYAHMVQVTDRQYFPVTGKTESWFVPWEAPEEWAASSRLLLDDPLALAIPAARAAAHTAVPVHSTTLRAS